MRRVRDRGFAVVDRQIHSQLNIQFKHTCYGHVLACCMLYIIMITVMLTYK